MKRREPPQEPIVDDPAVQKPAMMVEMPDNFAELTDDEIAQIEKENEAEPVEIQPGMPGSDQAAALSRETNQ